MLAQCAKLGAGAGAGTVVMVISSSSDWGRLASASLHKHLVVIGSEENDRSQQLCLNKGYLKQTAG